MGSRGYFRVLYSASVLMSIMTLTLTMLVVYFVFSNDLHGVFLMIKFFARMGACFGAFGFVLATYMSLRRIPIVVPEKLNVRLLGFCVATVVLFGLSVAWSMRHVMNNSPYHH